MFRLCRNSRLAPSGASQRWFRQRRNSRFRQHSVLAESM